MPRTAITPIAAPGGYASAPTEVTLSAADVANKNSGVMSGKDMLLIFNSGAAPHTVTISSVNDDKNRKGDITAFSVAAGKYYVFGPIPTSGWMQSDGKLYFEADHAEIKFAVISLP